MKGGVCIAKEYEAKQKVITKMTRDGLKEENLVTGESKKLTNHAEELQLNKSSNEPSEFITKHRRKPRMQFKDEEINNPLLHKSIDKVNKAEDKLDKTIDKLPRRYKMRKQRIYDDSLKKSKSRLKFEEVDVPVNKPSRLRHPTQAITSTADNALHAKIYEVEKDNVGVEAGHGAERVAESSLRRGTRKIYSAYRERKLKPYRDIEKATKNVEKAQIKFQRDKMVYENPTFSTNPLSRFMQKQQIKRTYAKELREARKTGNNIASRLSKTSSNITKKAGNFIRRHARGLIAIIPAFLLIMSIGGGITSCSSMMIGSMDSVLASSYTAEDSDITGSEADYLSKEADLRNRLNNIESNYPGYDAYQYDLDEIGHNPYELAAYLTIKYEDYTRSNVQSELNRLFNLQYNLTTRVSIETRYRTETRWREVWDEEEEDFVLEEYEVEVPYEYKTLIISLRNHSLRNIMNLSDDELERFSVLMETRGNRESGFFPDNPSLAGGINISEFTDYDIPSEALSDSKFRGMMQEAEKYLGYPYVWGGSSPSTSFDCSGFVCWVLNHSGNGWNVGRTTAEGLRQMMSIIPPSEAKPGDIIYFQGTYNTPGASHVAIYVGNNMMIHCGDPIQYADITHPYWQEHFYCFGRMN